MASECLSSLWFWLWVAFSPLLSDWCVFLSVWDDLCLFHSCQRLLVLTSPLSFMLDQRVSDLHSGLCTMTSNWILALLYLIFLILMVCPVYTTLCFLSAEPFLWNLGGVCCFTSTSFSSYILWKVLVLGLELVPWFLYHHWHLLPKSSPQSTNLVKNYPVCLLLLLYLIIKLFLLCSHGCLICGVS